MNLRYRLAAVVAATGLVAAPLALSAPAANAALGEKSLYKVLLADTKKGAPTFDQNGKDFDILTAAVQAVLDAKPSSPVSVLADGSVKLTAFIPNDNAFERTGKGLGITAKNEEKLTGKYAAALGVDGLEAVLLYHVVPGSRITAKAAAGADGVKLDMASGETVKVNVNKDGIFLQDKAQGVTNPKVIVTDINAGNKQIAHAINRVLLPTL